MKQLREVIRKTLYVMDRPQKILCVIVLFLTFLGAALECLGVSVIIPLVQVIQDADMVLQSNLLTSHPALYEKAASLSYTRLVALISSGVIVLYLFKNFYFVFLSWFRVKFAAKIQREISVRMMASYLSRGYQFFLNTNYGEFYRGIIGDTTMVYTVLNSSFSLLAEGFTLLLIVIFLFLTDWMLACTVFVLALFCLLIIFVFFRKKMYRYGADARKYHVRQEQTLKQTFMGVKNVLILRKQRHFISEYESNRINIQKTECKQTVALEAPAHVIEGLCIAGLMAAICLRIVFIGSDAGFFATLSAFAVAAFRVLPSLGRISASLNSLSNALPSIDALHTQIVKAEDYAKEHPEALVEMDNPGNSGRLIAKGTSYTDKELPEKEDGKDRFQDKIELKDITFAYTSETGNVLKNVDLTLHKGESVALIGASGAGKSTLADILLGLLVPQSGGIYMDGTNITKIPDQWAGVVGYVPQTVYLYDASIRENVAFGESREKIDEDRVWEALTRAELADFVRSLPEGIETKAGDSGVRLSGGQRQRIAIARALYHRPEVLVLDEATSALDNETESAIMEAIESLQGQVTLLIVAHRLTTVRNCDVIYEVEEGRLRPRDKAEVLRGIADDRKEDEGT